MSETVEELRQALWDIFAAIGCDTDGDPTPAALMSPIGPMVLDEVRRFRAEHDELVHDVLPRSEDEATVIVDGDWQRFHLSRANWPGTGIPAWIVDQSRRTSPAAAPACESGLEVPGRKW